jgi:ABC-type nitrate/sulfonate/bicarbonate transport system substrate-binding protein
MSLYTSNQEYTLIKKNIEYNIFHPKDYGFDFYADILYTSENEILTNQKRVKNFTKASLLGWNYAFEHIEETVNLILEKYNTQNKTKDELFYEANVLKKLAYANNQKLGNIDKNKIQRTFDIYNVIGLTKSPIDLDKFIFTYENKKSAKTDIYTPSERKYINNHKIIKM